MVNQQRFFTTEGGTVQASGGFYIEREADRQLLAVCRAGEFAYVLTPRQMGKSSLMIATRNRLADEDCATAVIDLSNIGTQLSADQWYLGLLTTVEDELELETDVFEWWEANSHLGVTQRLTTFFEEIVLGEVAGRVVVFVDEIDTTLSLDFTDDFFIAIRALFVGRAKNPALERLSFVLIGVATPGDLIRDGRRTPFNIGTRINLADFTLAEAMPFGAGLQGLGGEAKDVLGWVMGWTEGHPFLTQRLCKAVVVAGQAGAAQGEVVTKGLVDEVAEATFLEAAAQREENNLKFVGDMLTGRAPDLEGVLQTYRAVRRGRRVADEEQSPIKSHLKLAGVVRREPETGLLRVRNEIYRRVFDGRWIREQLPERDWRRKLKDAAPVIIPLAAALAAAVPLGGMAWVQRNEAVKQRYEAEEKTQLAEQAQAGLKISLNETEIARKRAEEKEIELEQSLIELAAESAKSQKARKEAEENATAAKVSETEAQKQAKLAEESAREAKEQKANAEAQTQRAYDQRSEAEAAKKRAVAAQLRELSERTRAEEATKVAIQQADKAYIQAILSHASSSKASLLLNAPLDGRVAALKAWLELQKRDIEIKKLREELLGLQLPRLGLRLSESSPIAERVSEALMFGAYYDREFNLRTLPTNTFQKVSLREKNILKSHRGNVLEVAFSPDGQTIVSAGDDSTVKLWSYQGNLLTTLEDHKGRVWSVAFSPDGQIIASAGDDKTVKLWNRKGDFLTTFQGHNSTVWSVAFSPDGQTIASAGDDGTIKLWDRQGKLVTSIKSHVGSVWSVAFSPDSKTLASAGDDGTVRLWTRQGRLIESITSHVGSAWSVAFSPDGKTLASAGDDGTVRLWDRQGKLLNTMSGGDLTTDIENNNGIIWSVAFSPDGQTIASASGDSNVRLWDSQGNLLQTLEGHRGRVWSVAFSPDGQTIASAGRDRTVKLWNKEKHLLKTLQGDNGTVWSVAFNFDGQSHSLASAGEDGTIKLWGPEDKIPTLLK